MKNSLSPQAAQIYQDRRRKKLWHRIVSGMVCVVVFCTVYALILPAITLEKEPVCDREEHTHTEACYITETVEPTTEYLCAEELAGSVTVHTHDESCYDRNGDLVCPLPEIEEHKHDKDCYRETEVLICGEEETGHIHDETCYTIVRGDLCCELEESEGHAHTDACYRWTEVLSCGREEDLTGHIHSASCYTTVTELICEKEEITLHTHDESCYDEDGNLSCDKLQVLAHRHDETCAVEPEGEPEKVRVPVCGLEEHTHTDECYAEEESVAGETGEQTYVCSLEEHIHDETCYDESGNLTCELAEHAHTDACCAEEAESGYDAVYGSLSELPDGAVLVMAEEPESVEQDEGKATIPTYLFRYGDDAVEMTIQLTGDVSAAKTETGLDMEEAPTATETAEPDASQESAWTEGLVLAVIPQTENSETYLNAAEYAAANANEAEDLYRVLAYEFCFFRDGAELAVTGCRVTVELSPKEAAVEPSVSPEEEPAQEAVPMVRRAVMSLNASADSPVAEERTAETAIRISVLQDTDGGVTETDSALVTAEEAAGTVVRFTLQSSRLAVTLSQTANPHFTVQYYAYVEQAELSDSGILAVINTDNGGTNGSGNLPQNGANPALKYLIIDSSGKIVTSTSLEQVYQDHEYEYIEAPNLSYFNRLYENGNYALKEIWVQNDSDADWTKYTNPGALHFTNRESSVDDSTVLIRGGTRIRLVYDTTSGSYDNAASFYDYDITDGTRTHYENNIDWTNTTLFNTREQGINSAGNYDGNGAKLAFGNKNTGTGLEDITWNGNTLNKGNSNGYGQCTFGLALDLNDGKIRYAGGVTAPNLFNDGSAAGKTAFPNNSLTFARSGDAYTLVSVSGQSGIGVSGLDTFNNPNGESYTNNFWPLDGVSNTVDPQFGDPIHAYYRANGGTASKGDPLYAYAISLYGTPSFTFPRSDNSQNHNNYFGLNYAVSFDLTADYVGPLNYLFFGDDDMWVFLTDSGGNSRLVCDIGGVHSSVGEYVNLWDYIQKDDRTKDETYTLSFFYTERGASGSSCYMRFTLPSVSSATPEQTTGALRVEKEVAGAGDPDREFQFEIHFTDAGDNPMRDDYSYTRYSADGTKIKTDVLICDGGSFELKDGEYVVIRYLPVGTTYTITEKAAEGYTTAHMVNSGEVISGSTVTGKIKLLKTDIVHYTNITQYELPETGGTGTHWYTLGGLCLMAGALLLLYQNKTRGKGGRAHPC